MASNYSISTIVALLGIIQAAMCATKIPEAKDFFSKTINGNLSKITWAHAVNSKAKLDASIANDKIMMLEADVVLGIITGTNATIPIMAHPPAVESDLSLDEFLNKVLTDKKRGIKLDFKSFDAFNDSRPILDKYQANLTVPVWLNADILAGPVDADKNEILKPVDHQQFLTGAAASLPESTLSVGWTTRYGSKDKINSGNYTQDHIQEMISAVAKSKTKQTITYPVRAGLAVNSMSVLMTLLNGTKANNPTLTIWSSEGDTVDAAALSKLIKDIGVDKVYVDVPEDLWTKLDIKSAGPSLVISSITLVGSVIVSLAIAKLI